MKLFAFLLLACSLASAQQSSKPLDNQPWELGWWFVGGGFSVPGGTKDTKAFNTALRVGKVLTDDHGGGFLRGNFEWSADVIPFYALVLPAKTAYGGGFNPVNLKWNFSSSPRTVPYVELGGGVLFTNTEVPAGTSAVNFLTHATAGFQFFYGKREALTVTTRYEHISNAGLAVPNPGINTVQFQLGLNWFK